MKLTIVFCLFFVKCVIAGDELPLIDRLYEDRQLHALCGKVYNALNDITEAYYTINSRVLNEGAEIETLYSQVMHVQTRIDKLSSEIVDLESALNGSDGGYSGLFRQYSASNLSMSELSVFDQFCQFELRDCLARSYDSEYEDKVPVLVERVKSETELKIERKKKIFADLQAQLTQALSRISAAESLRTMIRITVDGVVCMDGEGYLLSDIIKMKRLYQRCFNQNESEALRRDYVEIQQNMKTLEPETLILIQRIS